MLGVHKAVAVLCVACAAQSPAQDVPSLPQSVPPLSGDPAFNPLPEMWGLKALPADSTLDTIDETFVLYVDKRARFRGGAARGRVYLADGEQLIVDEPFDPAGFVGVRALCACALEFESDDATTDIRVAAGALPARGRPVITSPARGLTRIEFALDGGAPSGAVRITGLVCWSADETVAALTTALPDFVKLTRKTQPNFENPPVDARPMRDDENDSRRPGDGQPLTLTEDTLGVDDLPTFEIQPRDAPQTRGPVKPGLLTWLRQLRTGEQPEIDNEDYFYFADDPSLQRLDRDQGIYFRTGGYWP